MTTTFPDVKTFHRSWVLVDAKDKVLGRLATRIAMILRGKHKPTFTPFLDTGDFVVVINAEKIALTGKKLTQKGYHRYSGYPSGHKWVSVGRLLQTHPERVIMKAEKGMLPEGPMGRHLLTKLKVYAGTSHPHAAQNPIPLAN